jgi:hypothetical protein
VERRIILVSGIFGEICGADDFCAIKGWSEVGYVAGCRKPGKLFSVDSRKRVKKVALSSGVDDVVKKRSELRAAKLETRVRGGLHNGLEIEALGQQQAGLYYYFQLPIKFAGPIPGFLGSTHGSPRFTYTDRVFFSGVSELVDSYHNSKSPSSRMDSSDVTHKEKALIADLSGHADIRSR